MSAIPLAVQAITRAGATPTFTAANADGVLVPNNGRTLVEVKNTGATQCVVTITPTMTVDGMVITAPTITVPITTGDKIFGPFDPNVFGTTVTMTFSQVVSCTIGAFTY